MLFDLFPQARFKVKVVNGIMCHIINQITTYKARVKREHVSAGKMALNNKKKPNAKGILADGGNTKRFKSLG